MNASEKTKLYCLIGDPVSFSLSPFIMSRAFSLSGIDADYTTLRVEADSLSETIRDLKDMGFSGINITYPHKETVLPCIDFPSERVGVLKAANTLHLTEKGIFGYNTDATGTAVALKQFGGVSLEGKKVVIFGVGGAARAAAFGVFEAGAAAVTFCVRDTSKAEASIHGLERHFTGKSVYILSLKSKKMRRRREAAVMGSDILINATPIGLEAVQNEDQKKPGSAPTTGAPSSILKDPGWIRADHCCLDFVYFPRETEFLKTARSRGATCVDGLQMLVSQAVEGFRLWTGRDFNLGEMVKALESHLAGGRK